MVSPLFLALQENQGQGLKFCLNPIDETGVQQYEAWAW
jgi:hypothetical protein